MPRPTTPEVFGVGSAILQSGASVSEESLVIPLSSALGENGFFAGDPSDAVELFVRVFLRGQQVLNESARQAAPDDVPVTITYGEYDAIVDPPGSGNTYRRDVWSLVAYQSVNFGSFTPSMI